MQRTSSAPSLRGRSAIAPRRPLWYGVAAAVVVLAKVVGLLDAWGSVVFWVALACAVVEGVQVSRELRAGGLPLVTASRAVVVATILLVPLAFDPRTSEAFNVTKYTLVLFAAAVLGVLTLAQRARRSRTTGRQGLLGPSVLGLLLWCTVATIMSVNRATSLIGAYGSYDGLLALAAYAVVFAAVASAFRDVTPEPLLRLLVVGSGGVVALYGAFQLHDVTAGGARWDWVHWATATFKRSSIWATFGNPNHLAGFLAVLLPLGVALAFVSRTWWQRALCGVLVAVWIVELAQTLTRGAWIAVLVGLPVLALAAAPEIRRRPVLLGAGVAALVVVVVAAGVMLASTRDLRHEASRLLKLGGGNTAAQRVEMWTSAVDVARDHPLVGTGPDTFQLMFPRYQTARFVKLYGPNERANGPHNVFMNFLATTGVPGLVLFVLVVVFAGRRLVAEWRRLRADERVASAEVGAVLQRRRLLVGGVAAGMTAYLVQASFDVQQVALSLVFWVLLGVVAAMPPDAGHGRVDGAATSVRGGPSSSARTAFGIAAAVAAVVLVIGLVPLTGPYRAELSYGAAARREKQMRSADDADAVKRELQQAISANPSEPMYRQVLAAFDLSLASAVQRSSPAQALVLVSDAVDVYRNAVRRQPRSADLQRGFADLLDTVRKVPGHAALVAEEERALRMSLRYNPWRAETAAQLADLLVERGRLAEAVRVADHALRSAPNDLYVARSAAKAHAAAGDKAMSRRLWRVVLRLNPGDSDAAAALKGGTQR